MFHEKNKRRATRRIEKSRRSAYARSLEQKQYRHRVQKLKDLDDDDWERDLEEYLYGKTLEKRTPEENTSADESLDDSVLPSDRGPDEALVENSETRGGSEPRSNEGE